MRHSIHSDKMGARLRKRRQEKGFTLDDFSKAIGISKGHLSSIENGRERATKDLLKRCEILLDLSFEEIDFSQNFSEYEIKTFKKLQEILFLLRSSSVSKEQIEGLNESLAPAGLIIIWSEEEKEYVIMDWTNYRAKE